MHTLTAIAIATAFERIVLDGTWGVDWFRDERDNDVTWILRATDSHASIDLRYDVTNNWILVETDSHSMINSSTYPHWIKVNDEEQAGVKEFFHAYYL
jgi:hypothetical protein